MKKINKSSFKILVLGIILTFNQKNFAQSVLITPSKSLDSDTLSIQKKLVVGAKYASKPANKLEVHANSKIRLSVDGNGRVGVGTSTPQNPFHVEGRTQLNGRIFINNIAGISTSSNLAYGLITAITESQDSSDIDLLLYEDSSYSPWLNFGKARGTSIAPATVQDGDDLFQINGFAYNSSDFYRSGGIQLYADGTPSASSLPTGMRFTTTKEGFTDESVRISIRNTGFVGIGTDEPQRQLSVQAGMNIDQANESDGTLLNGLSFGYASMEGISSRRFGSEFSNYNGLDFYTNNTIRMSLNNNGNVGIGTINPTQAKFVVNGNVNYDNTPADYGYLKTTGAGTSAGTVEQNYSIYASNRIAATEFNAFSDARIKDIKGITDNEKDLETISKIKITDYKFKDKIGKGNGNHKKVIAQQVESVYPQAVSKLTDCLPDIYKLAKIENDFVFLENHTLKIGERVKLIFGENQEIVLVKEVNEKGFEIEKRKSEIVNRQVFVYGREVSDFRSVDYEALSTLNISATQALMKRLNEAEKRISDLEKNQNNMSALEARLEALENKILPNN